MVASEKANCATTGESALDQSAEEVFLLDPDPCQRSSTWQQMRMASVIRFLVPLALLACVASSISRAMPLHPSKAASHHLHVIEEFNILNGKSVVNFFEAGIHSMGDLSGNMAEQVNAVKREADAARRHMKEWTDRVVAANQKQILDYVKGLSDAADELQNAEAEFVGLCDTSAQLLEAMGEELERKIASAESKGTSQDIADEQEIMKSTIEYAEGQLEKIKGHFQSTKVRFHRLAATSKFFSDQIEDNIEDLKNQKDNWSTGLAGGYLAAAAACGTTGVATALTGGAAAPTLVFCGAAVAAEGAGAIVAINKDFHNSLKRLKRCQDQFDDLEGKCDGLSDQAQTDLQRLISVQGRVHAEGALMHISTLSLWKHQVLPKNKKLVAQLREVVKKYQ